MSNLTQRDHLAAAINAAERLRTDIPLPPPYSLELLGPAGSRGAYSLVLVFHSDPEGLARWAAALQVPVTLRYHALDSHRPYMSAQATAYGVAVRMWALGDEAEYDRYRAAAEWAPDVQAEVVPLSESPMAVTA